MHPVVGLFHDVASVLRFLSPPFFIFRVLASDLFKRQIKAESFEAVYRTKSKMVFPSRNKFNLGQSPGNEWDDPD